MNGQGTLLPRLDTSRLISYGIQNEKSTHRIHADLALRKIFVYRTEEGIRILPPPIEPTHPWEYETNVLNIGGYRVVSYGKYKEMGLATARGYKVGYSAIRGCRCAEIPSSIFIPNLSGNGSTTSQKGKIAVEVIEEMFTLGLVPLQMRVVQVLKREEQIAGVDIASAPVQIQIKCDLYSAKWGLFLQTHEWNPDKAY